ncbi:hypothetical protein FIBSPDRAFT_867613 [Athelia psychrophila]|uniref:Uncharacterized protein n=1 Tax=Athelia psychrophila TaxID=1759441 RepID=A0A166DX00_9AGAM|nr:hypothetical protein FIBSPDRAFT_867613 [Fibularhizoctonia sp. CBS 109695]
MMLPITKSLSKVHSPASSVAIWLPSTMYLPKMLNQLVPHTPILGVRASGEANQLEAERACVICKTLSSSTTFGGNPSFRIVMDNLTSISGNTLWLIDYQSRVWESVRMPSVVVGPTAVSRHLPVSRVFPADVLSSPGTDADSTDACASSYYSRDIMFSPPRDTELWVGPHLPYSFRCYG